MESLMISEIVAKTWLMPHQLPAVMKMASVRVGALFMDMGTGKTRTALELFLRRQHRADKLIWCCPVSLIPTIRFEMLKHLDIASDDIGILGGHYSDSHGDQRLWIVGLESVSGSSRIALRLAGLITENSMVVVDESTYIKGVRSVRSRRLTEYSRKCHYRMILSGTPITQGIEDIYSQMRFLSPQILGYPSFYSFAAGHLVYSKRFKGMIVARTDVKHLTDKIAPYTYQVKKDECFELPPKILADKFFVLDADEQRLYRQVKTACLNLLTEDLGDDASILIFMMFSILQQITAGVINPGVRDEPNGRHRRIGPSLWRELESAYGISERRVWRPSRVDLFETLVETMPSDEQIVAWGKYHVDLDNMAESLAQNEIEFREFSGRLSMKDREASLEAFRRGSARVLIATPDSGGHGIDLSCASQVLFYNNSFKYSTRVQAEDRVHRLGQERKVLITSMFDETGIGRRIHKAMCEKRNALCDFRDELQKARNDVGALKTIVESM
jgi:SNF2 family DNA or RNA helicase